MSNENNSSNNNSISIVSTSSYEVSYNSTQENVEIEDDNIEKSAKKTKKDILNQLSPQYPDRLYASILKATEIENVVCYWINNYRSNSNQALMELFQLFVDLSCYQHINVVEYFQNHENDLIAYIENSQNVILRSTGKYFLQIRTKPYIMKHEKVATFFTMLVEQSIREKIIFDCNMFFMSSKLLLDMSKSKIRPIKHTGVFITLKYQTGLVNGAVKIANEISAITNMYKEGNYELMEKTHKSKIKEMRDFYIIIERMIKFLQDNIYDANWNFGDSQLHFMREECILEVYSWMKLFPTTYLQNNYLNFIIEAITDSNKIVRYSALECLSKIIEKHHKFVQSKLPKLLVLISGRIKDVDFGVAIMAVDTIISLKKYVQIPNSVRKQLCEHVYNFHFPLASACGRYVVECMHGENQVENDERDLLKKFLIFEKKSMKKGFVNKYPWLVEAVYDHFPVLQNIKLFISLIETGNLDDEHESILLNIFTESVHIMLTGKCSKIREKSFKRATNKEQISQVCTELIVSLRSLTYFCSLDKLTPLLLLIQKYQCV